MTRVSASVLHVVWWSLVIYGSFAFLYWVLIVPGADTRAMLCPVHVDRIDLYEQLAERRRLKLYEQNVADDSRAYVERWCQ